MRRVSWAERARGRGRDVRASSRAESRGSRADRGCASRAPLRSSPGVADRRPPPASPPRPHGRRARADRRGHRAPAERLRAGGLLAALVGALRLQALRAAAAPPADRRARACCRGRARTRASSTSATASRVAFKVESHNHPSADRALPGRRHRRRRHPARHLRDGRAADRDPRLAALRRARRARTPGACSTARCAASGTTATASASPNVGGEVVFEPGYEQNCLVNAMCVGVLPAERLQTARRRRAGQRRGAVRRAHRAATASAAPPCSPRRTSTRATPRSGPACRSATRSPGKRLIECSLELVERDLLTALQDLGAAGLASSSSEMAARGPVGLELDLDLVPLREDDLQPFEVMLSESQERMLAVVAPERLAEVRGRLRPLGARARRHRPGRRGRPAGLPLATARSSATCPATALVDACPRYPLDAGAARPPALGVALARRAAAAPADLGAVLLRLLAAPNICDKAWVFRQYDQFVGSGTVLRPGGDAGVVRLTPSERAIAVAARRQRPPHLARPARAAARRRSRGGAERRRAPAPSPAAITNCLNFGNPERGETPYMLTEAIEGMAEACRALGHAGRVRQRLALQRARRRPDPADADRRLRRPARVAPTHAVPAGRPGRRRPSSCCSATGRRPRSTAPSTSARCTARSRAGRRRPSSPPARALHALLADGGPRAAPAQRPRRRRRRPRRGPGRVGAARRPRRRRRACPDSAGRADVSLFGEGPAAVVVSVRAGRRGRGWRRSRRRTTSPLGDIGQRDRGARDRRPLRRCALRVALTDAAEAHAGTLPAAMAGA